MTIGLVFHTSVIAYLLVGIPITIIFQRYVRRAPLKAMWVRDSPPFRLGLMGVTFAIGLSVAPLADLIMQFRSHGWIVDSWYLVAIIGAWPAAYALRYFRRRTFRELLISIFTAGAVGSAIMVAAALAGAGSHQSAWSKVAIGLASFLEYVPVTFLLEEVWFRGVLDSHLHHRGESRGGFSAIFVSALWGLWHYPISKEPYQLKTLLPTVLALLVVHIPIGALLSRSWRRSENLLVTCIVHALIDGVRDAVLGVPS
jgi:membrane protease YdiL (CAAX protease family)